MDFEKFKESMYQLIVETPLICQKMSAEPFWLLKGKKMPVQERL